MDTKMAGVTRFGGSVIVLKMVCGTAILIAVAGLNIGGGCQVCTNGCLFAADGQCDDGGAGSVTSLCGRGTDCFDCGPRKSKIPDIRDFLPVDASQVAEQSERPRTNDAQPESQDAKKS